MEFEFGLSRLWNIIQRRFWTIAIVFVLVLVVGGLYAGFGVTRLYRSEVVLSIGKPTVDSANSKYNDLLYFSRQVNSYQKMIKDYSVINRIKTELLLDEAAVGSLQERISIGTNSASWQMTISIADPDPVRAVSIANALATVLIDAVADNPTMGRVDLAQSATSARSSSSASFPKIIFAAALLGLMLGFDCALLLEMLGKKASTELTDEMGEDNGTDELLPVYTVAGPGNDQT